MSQSIESRPGWGRKVYRFIQRPVVIIAALWAAAILSMLASYRAHDIAGYIIDAAQR